MASDTAEAFETRFRSQTETYLESIDACVASLPRLIDQYAAEDPSYRRTVERIHAIESDCDETNRRISTLIANADVDELGLGLTNLHLNTGTTIDLYQQLDEIANTAERFAAELDAIEPPRSAACLDVLHEMADTAARTTPVLARTVTDYIEVLCDPYASATLGADITRIRAAESDCDDLRTDAIAAAFDGDVPVPVVYREFANILDAVVDAMEDVADRIVWVTGSESRVAVELTANR
jgi:uncharacterized protein Yka (UPF0111/DUF47 family)